MKARWHNTRLWVSAVKRKARVSKNNENLK